MSPTKKAIDALVHLNLAIEALAEPGFDTVSYLIKMAKLELQTVANNISNDELKELTLLISDADPNSSAGRKKQ
jgi:hypothetical protein